MSTANQRPLNYRRHAVSIGDDESQTSLIVDRLADVMLDTDDLLALLQPDETRAGTTRTESRRLRWMETRIQGIYDDLNELMKRFDQ